MAVGFWVILAEQSGGDSLFPFARRCVTVIAVTRSSRVFRRSLSGLGVGLLMMLLLSAGCAHREVSFHGNPERTYAVGPSVAEVQTLAPTESPAPEAVAPADAWWLAEEFARGRRNCEALVGSGGSMLPLYRDRTVIVVERMEMARLRPGMTVVFFGDSGRMVAHTLVAATPQGWVAQGLANRERDRTLVRARNYVGTVIKAYAPDPRVPSVRSVPSAVATVALAGGFPSGRTTPEGMLALAPARAN